MVSPKEIHPDASTNASMDAATDAQTGSPNLGKLTPHPEEFHSVATDVIGNLHPNAINPGQLKSSQKRWPNRFGLRTKVILAAILTGVLPTLMIGGLAYQRASSATRAQIFQTKASRSVGLIRRLQIYMGFRLADTEALAGRLDLQGLQSYSSKDIATLQRIFDSYLNQYQVYDNVALFDLQGNPIAQSSGPALENISSKDYFQTARTGNSATYTLPQLSGEIQDPVSFFAAPVKLRTTGETIGVVRLRLPKASLFASVSDINADGDELYVIDDQGNYLLTPPDQEALVGKALNDRFPGLNEKVEAKEKTVLFTPDADNQTWLVAASASLSEPGLFNPGWTGLIKTPEQEAVRAQRQLLYTLEIGLGVVAVLAAGLATVVANRAVQPLLSASAAVKRIGEGDLDVVLDVPAEGDELVQLGNNINLMGSQLKSFLAAQESDARLATLLGDMARLQRTAELALPLDGLLHEMQRQVGGDRLLFQRITDAQGSSHVLAEAVLPHLRRAQDQTFPALPEALLSHLRDGQQAQAYSQITTADLGPALQNQLQSLQVQSLIYAPIFVNNELYGLLSLQACDQPQHWSAEAISQFSQLTSRLALSLNAVESFEQTQARAQQDREQKEALQRELVGLLSDVEGASSGDLTVRAQITDGEIGIVADFFNAIVENLRDIVTQVKQASGRVNSSVSENGESIRKLSEDAFEQAGKIEITLESIEAMTNALQSVARQASEAAKASETAETTAKAGGQAMESTVRSISQVRETVAETAKKVKRLGESSQQISKVVELINQIALKTNLLAVNAGIEAARAGEEGRGFAVVAEEVGALAAQSAMATKDIEQIIAAIQSETTDVVEAMETSTTQVVEGTRSVEEAQNSLVQILAVSRQVNQAFQLISRETTSQATTSEGVKQLMAQLAQVSTETSTASRSVSASLQETVEITEKLKRSVDAFKVDKA